MRWVDLGAPLNFPAHNASGGNPYAFWGWFEDDLRPTLWVAPTLSQASTGPVNNITIGAPQGEHSGNADCVMRYFNAHAYRPQDLRVRYEVDEVKGIILCTSATGTGVNDADRGTPQPRYGDAASGRGNCKGQICVNDRYNFSAEHRR